MPDIAINCTNDFLKFPRRGRCIERFLSPPPPPPPQGEHTLEPAGTVDGIPGADVLLPEAVLHLSALLLAALLPRAVLPTSQEGGHTGARPPRDRRAVLHVFGLLLQVSFSCDSAFHTNVSLSRSFRLSLQRRPLLLRSFQQLGVILLILHFVGDALLHGARLIHFVGQKEKATGRKFSPISRPHVDCDG